MQIILALLREPNYVALYKRMKDYRLEEITKEQIDGVKKYEHGEHGISHSGHKQRNYIIQYELIEDNLSDQDSDFYNMFMPSQNSEYCIIPPIGTRMLFTHQYVGGVGDDRNVGVYFEVVKHEYEFDWMIYAEQMFVTIFVKPDILKKNAE